MNLLRGLFEYGGLLLLLIKHFLNHTEAATRGLQLKRLFLRILLYSQENTCVGQGRCFSVNIAKFLRTPILKKHLRTAASDHNVPGTTNIDRKNEYIFCVMVMV